MWRRRRQVKTKFTVAWSVCLPVAPSSSSLWVKKNQLSLNRRITDKSSNKEQAQLEEDKSDGKRLSQKRKIFDRKKVNLTNGINARPYLQPPTRAVMGYLEISMLVIILAAATCEAQRSIGGETFY
jgi:hypothetical protein